MMYKHAAAFLIFCAAALAEHVDTANVYHADLKPSGGGSATARVIVYAYSNSSLVIGAVGVGLEEDLNESACSGGIVSCGFRIYSGTSCEDIGSAYGNNWMVQKYVTNNDGMGMFGGLVETGKTDSLAGRPVNFHKKDGSTAVCGILQPIMKYMGNASGFTAELEEVSGSNVKGLVTMLKSNNSSEVCFFGMAEGLEANLKAIHYGGEDCTATNGCGTHVHSGTSCESQSQGGHFYDSNLPQDPWLTVGYPSTDGNGKAYFAHCVQPGVDDADKYNGKPFIIHSNDGSRKACGLLEIKDIASEAAHHTSAGAVTFMSRWSVAFGLAVVMVRAFF